MNITYTYEIQELKAMPSIGDLEKVIVEVVYSYIGTSEDNITSQYPGRTALPAPASDSFTAVEDLTPEIVISWIEANTDLDVMKNAIKYHIEQQTGLFFRGQTLPWAEPISETSTESAVESIVEQQI
jgi:hypothetical protein